MAAHSTRTMLFGVLVVAARPLTTGQITALAEPLGISATNAKSHLTRMVADGSVRRSGPRRFTRYSPAIDRRELIEGISARLEVPQEQKWDGCWLLLTLRLPSGRRERSRVRESLWCDGFRPWSADVFLRPAWPKPWALTRAQAYLRGGVALCVLGEFVGELDWGRVRAMYSLDALDRAATRLAKEINAMRAGKRSVAEAFAARLNVGGRVARLVAHDPRLPAAFWGSRTGLEELRTAYRRFEETVGPRAQKLVDQVMMDSP